MTLEIVIYASHKQKHYTEYTTLKLKHLFLQLSCMKREKPSLHSSIIMNYLLEIVWTVRTPLKLSKLPTTTSTHKNFNK